MIQRALKVRIYPNKRQQVLIEKTFGCCRFIYNQMLNERIEVYQHYKNDENKRTLYEWKYKTEKEYKEEYSWLKEVDATALQQSRKDLIGAYNRFFTSLKSKNDFVGFPKFKKKTYNNSFTSSQAYSINVNFNESKISLPKLKDIKYRYGGIKQWYKEPTSRLINITISKSCSGKYYASCLFCGNEDFTGIKKPINKTTGLDCSLSKFYVDEQGKSPDYVKNYKMFESKLAKAQRNLSRKSRGSNNFEKARIKVAKIQEHIANKRLDFVNKLSTTLIRENDCIVVENLNLREMAQSKLKLGKSVYDLGYSMFVNKLIYKAKWRDKTVVIADRWFASSKICHVCGYVNKDLTLNQRKWECPCCGTYHDRDQNAAVNLYNLVNSSTAANVESYACEE